MASKVLKARAAKGVAARAGDLVALELASRDLAAAKIEQYVAQVVAEAPRLTPSQQSTITVLLRGGASAND